MDERGLWEQRQARQRKSHSAFNLRNASDTRGHQVRTDATSQGANLPIVDAAYQGDFHDAVRDAFADALTKGGNTVLKEVPITLPGDQPVTAKIDILVRTQVGYVFGIRSDWQRSYFHLRTEHRLSTR